MSYGAMRIAGPSEKDEEEEKEGERVSDVRQADTQGEAR